MMAMLSALSPLRWLVAAVLCVADVAAAWGAEPGVHISAHVPGASVVGQGKFTYFGFHVYDGALFASSGRYTADAPFALELTYARELKGAKIAERSIDEIAALGIGTPAERAAWLTILTRLFPDVREHDRITGIALGERALFYVNGRPVDEIADGRLARAFFAIWLDSRTSAPAFRRKLLGQDK